MATIDDLFAGLDALVNGGALARGFARQPDRPADPATGDRTARWRRGGEEVRLNWDGREQWVTFEYRIAADAPAALDWTGTLSERFSSTTVSDADIEALREGLARVASTVWARRAAP